jgi:hypothetical protein
VIGAINHTGGYSHQGDIIACALYSTNKSWIALTDAYNTISYEVGLQTRYVVSMSEDDYTNYSVMAIACNYIVEEWGWAADQAFSSGDWPTTVHHASTDRDHGNGYLTFNGATDRFNGFGSAGNLVTGAMDRVIHFWAKRDGSTLLATGNEFIFAYGAIGDGGDNNIYMMSNVVIGVDCDNTSAYITNGTPGSVYDTNWHHYVVCYDQSLSPSNCVDGWIFFQDGRQLNTPVRTGGSITINTGIGNPFWGYDGAANYCAFSLDEFHLERNRVWDEIIATNCYTNATAVSLLPGI